MTDYDRAVKDGCTLAGLAAVIGLIAIFFWPLALGMFLFIGGAILIARYWWADRDALPQRPDPPLHRLVAEIDTRQLPTGRIRAGIAETIRKHPSHPVIQALGNDILREADQLCEEAARLSASRSRAADLLSKREERERAVEEAASRVETEADAKVKATLMAALERRRADLENLQQISDQARLWDALLEQAEATLTELQSKLTLTLSATGDEARQQVALTETSRELRSLSETLRQTEVEVEGLSQPVST